MCDQHSRYDLRDNERKYFIVSKDRACFAYEDGTNVVVECEDLDEKYFRDFFDLDTDYGKINDILQKAARDLGASDKVMNAIEECAGLRILRQDVEETLYNYILTPMTRNDRVRTILENLCTGFEP